WQKAVSSGEPVAAATDSTACFGSSTGIECLNAGTGDPAGVIRSGESLPSLHTRLSNVRPLAASEHFVISLSTLRNQSYAPGAPETTSFALMCSHPGMKQTQHLWLYHLMEPFGGFSAAGGTGVLVQGGGVVLVNLQSGVR